MRLQHRTIPCTIDLSACGLDRIEESDDAFVIGASAKQSGCCEVFAEFFAPKTGRPAKCLYTREETFSSSNSRHQMVMHMRVGARKDGSITAIDLYALSNAGAYGEHASTTIGLVGHKTLPIYGRAAASRFTYDVVYTNTMRGGAYRGYGATQGCFAVESAVNELADRLGIDPIDLRRRNLVQAGEVMPQYYNEPLRSCKLDECLVRARQMIGWDEKGMVRDLGDSVRGLAVAVTMQGSGISNIDIGSVDLRFEESGFVTMHIGATDVGTGCDTVLAQIAGEERRMSCTAFANECVRGGDGDCLTAHAAASSPVSPPPFMAGIAEVDVEKATGKVTLVDCGTVVNASLARAQAEGGIAQGIGMALTEEVSYSVRGRSRGRSFMTYKLPARLDIPQIRIAFEPSFEPTGPFGAKSIGEVVINTPSPAIVSAVAHATGAYVRELPITPERILRAQGDGCGC